jgi:hypothetical protein
MLKIEYTLTDDQRVCFLFKKPPDHGDITLE